MDAIRARAAAIRRRRQAAVAGSAGAVVLVLAVLAVALPGSRDASQLAGPPRTPAPTAVAEALREDASEMFMDEEQDGAPAAGSRPSPTPVVAQSGRSSDGAASAPAQGTPAPGELTLTLHVPERPVAPAEKVILTLEVCNRTSTDVEASFRDAQRYDFEVYRYETLVWVWSKGRSFAQVMGVERWAPDECRSFSEEWPKVDNREDEERATITGRYDAVGVLVSDPQRRSSRRGFCLTACP